MGLGSIQSNVHRVSGLTPSPPLKISVPAPVDKFWHLELFHFRGGSPDTLTFSENRLTLKKRFLRTGLHWIGLYRRTLLICRTLFSKSVLLFFCPHNIWRRGLVFSDVGLGHPNSQVQHNFPKREWKGVKQRPFGVFLKIHTNLEIRSSLSFGGFLAEHIYPW